MTRFAGSLLLLVSTCGHAQTFEVASIRPSTPPEMGRGPGGRMRFGPSGGAESKDPTRFNCDNCNLSTLVMMAYDIQSYQLISPSSMGAAGTIIGGGDRFDIRATLAEGTTKEQQRVMLQNLLVERFKLKIHHESKEMQMYELVTGKSGPKMTESVEETGVKEDTPDGPPPGPRPQFKLDKDGFPELPAGSNGMFMMNGRGKMSFGKRTMADLAKSLSAQLRKPVTDATGLKGKYDFQLSFTMEMGVMPGGPGGMVGGGAPPPPPPPGMEGGPSIAGAMSPEGGPTIFAAVQQQLGLKLDSKKGQVDVIVIDHVDKVPTEN